MKTIKVPDMKCIHCKERIEKGMAAENIKAEVNLDDKTVKVEESALKAAIEELEDLGFTPEVAD